jgi:hypothetical protein
MMAERDLPDDGQNVDAVRGAFSDNSQCPHIDPRTANVLLNEARTHCQGAFQGNPAGRSGVLTFGASVRPDLNPIAAAFKAGSQFFQLIKLCR